MNILVVDVGGTHVKILASGGGVTHPCMRASYTDTVGAGKPGSAKAPTGMVR